MRMKKGVVVCNTVNSIKIGVGDVAIGKMRHIGLVGMTHMMDKLLSLIDMVNKCVSRPALMLFVQRIDIIRRRDTGCGISIVAVRTY